MADTASLIARVKTEGVEEASRQLTALGRTSEQVDTAIARMTGDVGKTNKAMSDAARGGLSSFRNAAGQVGFQVQDMVVQLQSGTSAFVAIGQQGSQLAGAFGPGGAVLGAVIALASAVGGVLYKSLGVAGADMDDLTKRSNELGKSFQITKSGTLELSDSFIEAANSADGLSQNMVKLLGLQVDENLNKTTKAIENQRTAWEGTSVAAQTSITTFNDLSAAGVDVGSAIANIGSATPDVQAKLGNLNQFLDDQAEKYGVNKQLIIDVLAAERDYANAKTPEAYQKVADAKTAVADAATENKEAALDEARTAQQLSVDLETLAKQSDVVAAAQNRQGKATNTTTQRMKEQTDAIIAQTKIQGMAEKDRFKASAELEKQEFARREGVTKEQIAAFNKARDEEAAYDEKKFQEREDKKTAAAEKAAAAREAAASKHAATAEAAQKKQAEDFLNLVARTNEDEFKAIDAQEQQKLEKLQKFNEQGRIVGQKYEDAKTQIALDADTKRNDLLQKQTEERMKKQDSADNFMAQLRAQNEGELAEIDRQENAKLKKLEEFKAEGLDIEGGYQAAKENIAAAFDKERVAKYSSMLGQTTDDLKTALGEGNKAYKAFAIANAIMNTYQGAVAAFQSAAAIPLVGWIAAPVAAAAAVAAGLANVAKIRSAREQGGSLAAGGISMVGERNKAELIMPAGASRVRTMEQVQQMMGGKGANANGTPAVTIVNNTSGRIDSATTEQDDEGRLRVIISETVSRALQDSNSQISKSRRATRGQPGFS